MKKILVTGANGQLGSELRKIGPLYPSFAFDYIDIDTLDLSNKQVFSRYFGRNHFDYILNCAAYTAVDKAETETQKAFLLNAEVPGMLQAVCTKNKSRLIHMSTDYVFDGRACEPYVETDPANPQSVYARSKLAGEQEVLKNPDNIIIRTSWLYSVHGANFMKTMLRLGKERKSLNVVFDQVGNPTSAADLADTLLKICSHLESTGDKNGGIYHYSNEGVCSWYDFALEIMELAGLNCQINPITSDQYPSRVKRPAFSVLNKAKIKATFGLEIPHWKKSLKKVVKTLT
ncbi:MAG: dTDP-4-dehydrorhamnose reductase [Bacteroidales bacterium]|nr:dTDP-4-dehydrorhamnose reductase [Bacteroidales bacterium]MBN2763078.1 dTDP-4-dehydrorhamnose reductase [Bacteroidales bacterium]